MAHERQSGLYSGLGFQARSASAGALNRTVLHPTALIMATATSLALNVLRGQVGHMVAAIVGHMAVLNLYQMLRYND